MKDENRFEIIKKEWRALGTEGFCIICDKETGVQYLFSKFAQSGGLTVLVDKDGKPIIS